MRSTLFYIPREIAGIPLFGFGLILALWVLFCVGRMGWRLYHDKRDAPAAKGKKAQAAEPGELWKETFTMLAVGAIFAFVLPAAMEPNGLPIRGYGLMVFLGVVSGVALAVNRAKQEGISPEVIYSLALWMCVGGIVGARLFYIIEYWDHFQKPTLGETLRSMLNFTKGGLVIYGCFLGGSAAGIVFFIRRKLPVLVLADVIAPSMTLGLALGRVGCFLNGCCFGGTCDLPWAVSFPPNSPVYQSHLDRAAFTLHGIHFEANRADAPAVVQSVDRDSAAAKAGLKPGDRLLSIIAMPDNVDKPFDLLADESMMPGVRPGSIATAQRALARIQSPQTITIHALDADGNRVERRWTIDQPEPPPTGSLPVHPAQLYSAIDAFLLTLLLLAWYPFRRHAGEVTALMITIYPISRFLQEIIRTDEMPVFGTGMSISQNISILLLVAAAALWIVVLKSPRLKYTG